MALHTHLVLNVLNGAISGCGLQGDDRLPVARAAQCTAHNARVIHTAELLPVCPRLQSAGVQVSTERQGRCWQVLGGAAKQVRQT